MTKNLKVSYLSTLKNKGKPCWYITDGYENYMRADGTWHGYMTQNGGTYFSTKQRAERCLDHWTDEPAAPTKWGEMTDAEKGALLLANHDGKEIQAAGITTGVWMPMAYPVFQDDVAYRVRPPEPVRETVTIAVDGNGDFSEVWQDDDTCRITFPVLNGDIPTGTYSNEDGERIVVERIND